MTDAEGSWSALPYPIGRVEGGKALAAEHWLDPIGNGWQKPHVDAVARTEWADRPLGGEYWIELPVPRELSIARIERLQLLAETAYWTRQR